MDTEIKRKLALSYRIIAKFSMDDLTYTHLSARSSSGESFYIFPFGSLFSEVTPDSLLEVSLDGKVLQGREDQYNRTGYVIHCNLYRARQDINAIFHLHTIAGVAVSVMKFGLLPLSQFALHFYNLVSYHDYDSLALDHVQHGQKMVRDLDSNKVMILRNHGTITAGATIEEAMFYTRHLEKACRVQVEALRAGYENLIIPDAAICQQAVKDLLTFEKNLGYRDSAALTRGLLKNYEFS